MKFAPFYLVVAGAGAIAALAPDFLLAYLGLLIVVVDLLRARQLRPAPSRAAGPDPLLLRLPVLRWW